MLKIYNTLEEVPEGLREHYKKSDGRYVPDLSEDHPVVVHNKQLLSEKSTATGKVRELEADIEEMKKTSVPRAHVAVPKTEVDLLTQYKALGKTPEELKVIATEHGTLKESETKRAREDKLTLVAKELGYDAEMFKRLSDLPDFDIRDGKDGKKSVIALVRGEGDKVIEKPATEFLESSPGHAPFINALKTPSGVKVHGTSSTTTTTAPGDPYAWAKQFADEYSKSNVPAGNLHDAFYGVTKPAV